MCMNLKQLWVRLNTPNAYTTGVNSRVSCNFLSVLRRYMPLPTSKRPNQTIKIDKDLRIKQFGHLLVLHPAKLALILMNKTHPRRGSIARSACDIRRSLLMLPSFQMTT